MDEMIFIVLLKIEMEEVQGEPLLACTFEIFQRTSEGLETMTPNR